MSRKSASAWLRVTVAAASWAAAVSFVQGTVGADIAQGVRESEERIELRMRERREPPSGAVQPVKTHEESIEPWELVIV